MAFIEIAVLLIAIAFAVLVGFLVPALIEVKKTVAESHQLLARMNADLPSLIKEMRETTENMNTVAGMVKDGMAHASVLLHAVGDIGETVQEVHDTVRGQSGRLLVNLASVVAGFKAASAVVKERMHNEGGESNGG
ncbi:MAG: DUF948 domain-containing protein [Nitrospirota bacterium]